MYVNAIDLDDRSEPSLVSRALFRTKIYVKTFMKQLKTWKFWLSLILGMFVLFALFVLSCLCYAGFYHWYVPKIYHELPVHFQYDSKYCVKSHTSAAPPKPLQTLFLPSNECQEANHVIQLPWASVPFLESYPHGHEFLMPVDMCSLKLLSDNQLYDISLSLKLPYSNSNALLGNFMVRCTLYTCNDQILYFTSKPVLLPCQSFLKRVMFLPCRIIFLLFGWTDESYEISIPLLKNVSDPSWKVGKLPIARATIELSNPQVEIYSATLNLDAQFSGLRYFMYFWFATSAFIFICSIFFTLVCLFLVFALYYTRLGNPKRLQENAIDALPDDDLTPKMEKHEEIYLDNEKSGPLGQLYPKARQNLHDEDNFDE